jgi:hypothetical protein
MESVYCMHMKCSNINKIYESFTCQSGYCYAHLFTACSQCIFTAEADIFIVRAREVTGSNI